MVIYTLKLPQVKLKNRTDFLNFTQREVIELALKNKQLFLEHDVDAQYFHKDSNAKNRIPVRINAFLNNGLYCLRAYGNEAVDSLRFWFQLFMQQHPEYEEHLAESLEYWTLKLSDKPLYYSSDNWIPFNHCAETNGVFYDGDKQSKNKKNALESRLIGNLRSFLMHIGVDNKAIETHISLEKYPKKYRRELALKTKVNGDRKIVYKSAFKVKIKTNVVLPLCFSLGQNVGYGNGVFFRDF